MNKRSSKGMMIVLFVFLLFATAYLLFSLQDQIGELEVYRTAITPHGSKETVKSESIYEPIIKAYEAIQVGVLTVSIGFIVFAIFCIRRKLYGRMEVVTLILTLVFWVAAVLVRNM
jgi:hypothetical protein